MQVGVGFPSSTIKRGIVLLQALLGKVKSCSKNVLCPQSPSIKKLAITERPFCRNSEFLHTYVVTIQTAFLTTT
jgi:hypothetical protein